MSTTLNPYLSFRGQAAAALAKYHSVFGGELTLTRFAEFGMPVADEESDWVMHGQLITAAGHPLMAADTPGSMAVSSNGVVALTGDDESTIRGWWDGLADGATIDLPLERAPWGDYYGQLTDEFGVSWMFDILSGTAG